MLPETQNKEELQADSLGRLVAELVHLRQCTLQIEASVSEVGRVAIPRIWHWSSIGWQFGHIACFEEAFVLARLKRDKPLDPRKTFLFMPATTPPPERIHVPSRAIILEYLHVVRNRVLGYVDATGPSRDLEFTVEMLVEHESMHLEHLLHMCCWLPVEELKFQQGPMPLANGSDLRVSRAVASGTIAIPGGMTRLGGRDPGRVWDNENPAFDAWVNTFAIERSPVTNRAYLDFIESGGYQERRWWSDDGWGSIELTGAEHPYYWFKEGEDFKLRTLFARSELPLDHPVMGLSWFEAEAYANFAGKRLLSEAEWERAALLQPRALANCDFAFSSTTPVGAISSPAGVLELAGNVWEWTASWFQPYAGFVAGPYQRYSEPQFGNVYRVLKGGCWATISRLTRPSFRNWYNPHLRQIFAGVRLASTIKS